MPRPPRAPLLPLVLRPRSQGVGEGGRGGADTTAVMTITVNPAIIIGISLTATVTSRRIAAQLIATGGDVAMSRLRVSGEPVPPFAHSSSRVLIVAMAMSADSSGYSLPSSLLSCVAVKVLRHLLDFDTPTTNVEGGGRAAGGGGGLSMSRPSVSPSRILVSFADAVFDVAVIKVVVIVMIAGEVGPPDDAQLLRRGRPRTVAARGGARWQAAGGAASRASIVDVGAVGQGGSAGVAAVASDGGTAPTASVRAEYVT